MVQVYTKNYCPYCVKAKTLLHSLNVEFEEHDISDTPDKIQELYEKSGLQTVPQIFVGEKCLGGFSDIEKLHQEGKLLDLLKEA
ncbi:glutaredoxin 3 [Candidatus Peregrinibacteria bacterium]|nr:glutaredoxin 3 [Candidatus Peregrinibacteria bacterium]